MTNTTKLRIAVQSARELELEVENGEDLAEELAAAMEVGEGIVWLTDIDGTRHGVAIAKVAFVEIEGAMQRPGIGFSSSD